MTDHRFRFSTAWLILTLAAAALATAAAAATAVRPLDLTPEPAFERVGVDSIARDVVATLAQDRAGFLWIATGDGLLRYDGYRFQAHERESPVAAERNLGWIRALLPTRDGRLWISTESQGLAAYSPDSGRITLHTLDKAPAAGPAPVIQALAEAPDGAVWIGLGGGGLMRYDPQTGGSTRFHATAQAGSLPHDRIEALRVSRDGTLWIGSWRGLSRLRAGSLVFEPVLLPALATAPAPTVQSLLEAADGRIWVGTRQGELHVVDPASGQARRLEPTGSGPHPGAVTSLVQPAGGPVWVGRSSGIDWFDANDGRLLRQIRRDPCRPAGLAANEVSGLLVDRAGWVWVGGTGVGLQRHNPTNRSLALHTIGAERGDSCRDQDVRSVLHLNNGQIWVSTQQGGVVALGPALNVIRPVALPTPAPPTATAARKADVPPPGPVVAMAQSGRGPVWLAEAAQLHQLDAEQRPLRTLRLASGRTNQMLVGQDDTLWLAMQDGLYRLPPGGQQLQRVAPEQSAADGEVYTLAEAPDGALWVGGVSGVFRIAQGSQVLQPVAAARGRELANPVVIGLMFDRSGGLWLDTAVTGLHRMSTWDGRLAGFDRISQRHGIVNKPFGANLLEDARGRIWTHMHVYDPATDRLIELTPADGARLGNGRFHVRARTADGRLLFGGTQGLLVVRPETFDRWSYEPPLVVTELRIDGDHRSSGLLPAGLTLARQTRSFSLQFAALDYSDPGRIRYAYRLHGFDPGWIHTDADLRVASYSKLPPGSYKLQVRATNRSGVWSPHELTIPLRVEPAWWQTPGARLAALAALVATFMAAVRLRTTVLRRQQQALEHMVQQRTAELEAMSAALQRKSDELEAHSLTDPLTGLQNRRFLTEHIGHDIARSQRRYAEAALQGQPPPDDADLLFFMVDIDHFKAVNDTYGHASGDAVLMQMRGRLHEVFRASDLLVRWGGEEFLIVALQISRAHAADLAERVRVAVAARPFVLQGGQRVHKTCSIGFSCFPLVAEQPLALDWAAMVELADQALYRVKRSGRNGWLGVLRADAAAAGSLPSLTQRSLADWQASGVFQTVSSPPRGPWSTSAAEVPA